MKKAKTTKQFYQQKKWRSLFLIILILVILALLSTGILLTSQNILSKAKNTSSTANLVKNGQFEKPASIISTLSSLENTNKLAPDWKEVNKNNAKIKFSLQKNPNRKNVQTVEGADLGNGISQTVVVPANKHLIMSFKAKVTTGILKAGTDTLDKVITAANGWQDIELLVNTNNDIPAVNISFTAGFSPSSFSISDVTLKELSMKGQPFNDPPITNPLSYVPDNDKKQAIPSPALQENNTPERETIPVIINISHQVIADHCIGKDAKTTINPQTNRCPFVEELALRDLDITKSNFIGTNKKFVFQEFDEPWDQTRDYGCGLFNDVYPDVYLPQKACKEHPGSIYINVLYYNYDLRPSGVGFIGGVANTKMLTASYIAPRFTDGVDAWLQNSAVFWPSDWVLTHEIGHLFGQIHTPTILAENNSVLPGIPYPIFFYGELSSRPGGRQLEWAREIAKRNKLGTNGYDGVWSKVPETIQLDLFTPSGSQWQNGGKIDIYGTDVVYEDAVGERKITSSVLEENYFTANNFEIPGVLLKYGLLLLVITNPQGNKYYTWLDITDANFAYWQGNIKKAVILRHTNGFPNIIKGQVNYEQSLGAHTIVVKLSADIGNTYTPIKIWHFDPNNNDNKSDYALRHKPYLTSQYAYSDSKYPHYRVEAYALDRTGSRIGLASPSDCPGTSHDQLCDLATGEQTVNFTIENSKFDSCNDYDFNDCTNRQGCFWQPHCRKCAATKTTDDCQSNANPKTPTQYLKVFITTNTYKGNFQGWEKGDNICQELGKNIDPLFSGKYIAWLSDDYARPADRLKIKNLPYYTYSQEKGLIKVADDYISLTSKPLLSPIIYNEYGRNMLSDQTPLNVHTGTNNDGSINFHYHCNNWTENEGYTTYGIAGENHDHLAKWSYFAVDMDCNKKYHLYCFQSDNPYPFPTKPQQLPTNTPTPPPTTTLTPGQTCIDHIICKDTINGCGGDKCDKELNPNCTKYHMCDLLINKGCGYGGCHIGEICNGDGNCIWKKSEKKQYDPERECQEYDMQQLPPPICTPAP